jgi:alkylhydroperoxidase family enzyme
MDMKQTLTPIEPPYASNIEAILKNYPKQQGYLLKLFRVFANSERFLLKGVPNLLDKDSPISLREREIVILRVCANNACEYEWGVHVTIFSQHANLTSK